MNREMQTSGLSVLQKNAFGCVGEWSEKCHFRLGPRFEFCHGEITKKCLRCAVKSMDSWT